ncbi:hypothetical protein EVAR_76066_1 [Eumeta japonica]|uniref:Uncharacterized protein n=1 Tax=Eumeta variegata TaxID=151549 RepID=A0A4C1W3X9_EUMVA|nr:hypothetical protein EVAR_76066_1 [Eumeta japonica]
MERTKPVEERSEFSSRSSALLDGMVHLEDHAQRAVDMYALELDASLHSTPDSSGVVGPSGSTLKIDYSFLAAGSKWVEIGAIASVEPQNYFIFLLLKHPYELQYGEFSLRNPYCSNREDRMEFSLRSRARSDVFTTCESGVIGRRLLGLRGSFPSSSIASKFHQMIQSDFEEALGETPRNQIENVKRLMCYSVFDGQKQDWYPIMVTDELNWTGAERDPKIFIIFWDPPLLDILFSPKRLAVRWWL